MEAQGHAARIVEDGKATAEAVELMRQQWENGETQELFMIRMLPEPASRAARAQVPQSRALLLALLAALTAVAVPWMGWRLLSEPPAPALARPTHDEPDEIVRRDRVRLLAESVGALESMFDEVQFSVVRIGWLESSRVSLPSWPRPFAPQAHACPRPL